MAATTTVNKQLRIATRNCGFIDPESIDDYIALRGYEALAKVLTMTSADVVELVKKSGLRGRGGGGFPTGVKWGIALANQADQKYMVCNADEGDPGAFMDRAVLEGDPHSVVEAMAIGGYAIGATKGTVYIRAEYPLAIKRLRKAIEDARGYGLLGKNIFGSGFDFDIELKYGAGAFVCGEETALIKSMEGKRGEPVTKPPFPAQSGYWEKPTIVNNVETFANIPAIIIKGADWFSSIGTATSKGTKVFALAGKITNVGLIEVPMGTTLREVIFDIGGGCPDGKKFKAVQTGGPSGGALSYKDLDVAIDYESLIARKSMMGSGWHGRHGRGFLHGLRGQVLPGLHHGRDLRQVHPLPHRFQAPLRAARQDHQGQGRSGRPRSAQDPGHGHQGHRPVRPGPDHAQPDPVHHGYVRRRVCRAHQRQEVSRPCVHGHADLYH